MVTKIDEMEALVATRIQDRGDFLDAGAGAELHKFVDEAVKEYSRHRPQLIVEDESGDGGFDYQIAGTGGTNLLASWEDKFSIVDKLVFPVDDTSPNEQELNEDEWEIIHKIVTANHRKYIRFLVNTPTATETFRIFYTARHVLDLTSSTLPISDDEAVANLTAYLALKAIAARYLSMKDTTITADATDRDSKADAARRLAEDFKEDFEDHMGIGKGQQSAQSVIGDTDMSPSHGLGYVWHGQRNR